MASSNRIGSRRKQDERRTNGKRSRAGDNGRVQSRNGGETNGRSRFRSRPALRAKRKLDARRDTPDLRDILYVPTLIEVPTEIRLADYLKARVPILDQGREGACTGFGLATVVHYLLRRRRMSPDRNPVSPHMLYRMARRYDEWPGEEDAGSSARGAMKGWHRHGVCSLAKWGKAGTGNAVTLLTPDRVDDALNRPLGAYYRVNHQSIVAMHAAIAEVGILYATAGCHGGWDTVTRNGMIHYQEGDEGGHAFAIVAYDRTGFWIQNSWGPNWGRGGFGHIEYADWLKNGTDVWVARLGAPIDAGAVLGVQRPARAASVKRPIALAEVRPHVVGIGNDGVLRAGGVLGTDQAAVDHIFGKGGHFETETRNWKVKRLLLYAHGGLTDEEGALQRVMDYRRTLMEKEVYPVAFVWKTDYWTTIQNALDDAKRKRRPEGLIDATKNFLLDRLDDALEPLARIGTGKLQWQEMKENAILATESPDGGARLVADRIASLVKRDPAVELHVIGHSAGSVFHGPFVRLLTTNGPVNGTQGHGLRLATVTMWAPACTVELFKKCYMPAIEAEAIENFAMFTLTDKAEQADHCANIYHKSLLYLVSHALEDDHFHVAGMPGFPGEPILGMERWVNEDRKLVSLFKRPNCSWILTPNTESPDSGRGSTCQSHGGFDDDGPTLQSALTRMLRRSGKRAARRAEFEFECSSATWADRREEIMS